MINITSRAGRQRARTMLLRLMLSLEKVHTRTVKHFLDLQFNKAASSVQRGGSWKGAVNSVSPKFRRAIEKHCHQVALVFVPLVVEEKKGTQIEIEGPVMQEFWATHALWIKEYAGMEIVNIADSSKKKIARIIERGMEAGKTHREIAEEIREYRKSFSASRALTIARTETHTAAVHSMDSAVKATGLKMKRRWIFSFDNRTRVTHRVNQVRAMDKPFSIGTDYLMYPGDPNGDPANTVNCRCVLVYETAKR